ncbi:MAG: hypothetical protein GX651_04945 [Methanomicrobiales archaeon]|nr:hypothetical protein [Methanomicrobiales archaeon]
MTRDQTEIKVELPTGLLEKVDTIAKLKYQNRNDVIIDACAYYCQFYDMHNEQRSETMRNVLFDLARHDDEFRRTLRDVFTDGSNQGGSHE